MVPPIVLIGIRFRSAIVCGAALGMETSYSLGPIFDVPVGRIRFCALIALTTSSADRPFDCKRRGIQIDLNLTLLAAVGIRNRRARHGDELRSNEIQSVVIELLLG